MSIGVASLVAVQIVDIDGVAVFEAEDDAPGYWTISWPDLPIDPDKIRVEIIDWRPGSLTAVDKKSEQIRNVRDEIGGISPREKT